MPSKFVSVDDIVNYLREPTVSSTDSRTANNGLKSAKKHRTEKNQMSATPPLRSQPALEENIQILQKGRVRYGPITVNPRKQPSKTLYTGRRSKYEVLSGDEEEKRRDRRDRNRVAATKCREKRENVLADLEDEHNKEINNNKRLISAVKELQQRKNHLEAVISSHFEQCPLINNSPSSMIFGDTSFLSFITDAPPPPLPSYQQTILFDDEEELSHILDPAPVLTNSAYNSENSNSVLIPPQAMTNSSIEKLLNNLQSPTISMENSINNNHSMLFNSAIGSSCAKQHHSSSSEEDSLPPKHTNPYVC